ncbi:hypothetical protein [Williamsia sp.]|uniref:hypothetical protein n=1 Tax=Williamsia sp. TaxID=1872085 RepID=UPI001A218236|nr:hypothetical protein [Williamsia sp.]MBJ7291838.1 hypothetical protein [Williamsia sp.]
MRFTLPFMPQVDTTSTDIHRALGVHLHEVAKTEEPSPHVCPECKLPFVFPTEALEVDEWHFAVGLRCPNCDWEGAGIYDDEALERFDLGLDEGTRTLVAALDALSAANARDEADRFAAALQAGAILPEDF